MNFRTIFNQDEIQKPAKQISYKKKVALIGSCFVENISEKLSYFKFDTLVNPFGILFNPISIEKAIKDIKTQRKYGKDDLLFFNERWHSLHHHSDLSNSNQIETLNNINRSIITSYEHLIKSNHIIITLGTAWVYHHIKTDQIVANCHKIPQKEFVYRILSVNKIVSSLENTISLLKNINPSLQITYTLSPVRHLKDGMVANAQSKAQLLTAIHQIVGNSDTYYFPAYEIVTDDLRDYRFYESDMLHPNKTTIEYIWDIFKETWIDESVYTIMEQVGQVQKALQHKAFNPTSEQHLNFLQKLEDQKKTLLEKYKIKF